jgi:hypothetical protein
MTAPHDLPGPQSGGMTRAELLDLPVTVSIATAARALGLGRSTAYELARRDEFPAACCTSATPTVSRLRIYSESSVSIPAKRGGRRRNEGTITIGCWPR